MAHWYLWAGSKESYRNRKSYRNTRISHWRQHDWYRMFFSEHLQNREYIHHCVNMCVSDDVTVHWKSTVNRKQSILTKTTSSLMWSLSRRFMSAVLTSDSPPLLLCNRATITSTYLIILMRASISIFAPLLYWAYSVVVARLLICTLFVSARKEEVADVTHTRRPQNKYRSH